jgi:hypothetical protein
MIASDVKPITSHTKWTLALRALALLTGVSVLVTIISFDIMVWKLIGTTEAAHDTAEKMEKALVGSLRGTVDHIIQNIKDVKAGALTKLSCYIAGTACGVNRSIRAGIRLVGCDAEPLPCSGTFTGDAAKLEPGFTLPTT